MYQYLAAPELCNKHAALVLHVPSVLIRYLMPLREKKYMIYSSVSHEPTEQHKSINSNFEG